MTGHPTSGRPADREPTPTETTSTSIGTTSAGMTSAGATGSPAEGSGVEVDRVLAAGAERLLAVLQSTLDVNAGLAAIRATHRTATGHPASTRPDGDRHTGGPGQPDTSGEVGAVCLVLAAYLTVLAPAGDDRTGAPPDLGGSVLALGAVHRLLRELRNGLLHRTLDRHAADRLLRLIEHNTIEAGQLLREEQRRAGRRTRPQVEGWVQIAAGVRDGMVGLQPRILRLYEDADQAATTQPAPRLPV